MTLDDKNTPKYADVFYCKSCDFKCSKKSDYMRHITTRKHQKNDKWITLDDKKAQKNAEQFECLCGKKYIYRQGLWKHKKRCDISKLSDTNKNDDSIQNDFKVDKEFVMSLMTQNQELIKENNEFKQIVTETQNMMMEIIKNGTHNTTNNNSYNKTFNLQFFLNETCKNAMNIKDFVDSIQLQLTDLEKMGEIGYINGMSNIIIKNLKDMEVTDRPMHCTDVKRETLYVKDEDKWDKESDGNPKIKKAIKYIARKNAVQLKKYKEKHPDCTKADSKYSDTYNNLLIEAMGGKGDNDAIKEDKIIKKVAKEIIVDK
jgi:hypothetical protein